MKKFIYVFNKDAKNKMIASGYQLMKSDEFNSEYVFLNRPNDKFSMPDVSYIEDDILRF